MVQDKCRVVGIQERSNKMELTMMAKAFANKMGAKFFYMAGTDLGDIFENGSKNK